MSKELQEKSSEKSLIYAQQALLIAERLNFRKGIGDALYYIATAYKNLDVYSKSLEYFLKALKFYKSYRNHPGEANALAAIGKIYFNFGDYDQSLHYYLEALKVNEKINKPDGIALSLGNIGLIYMRNRDYTLAQENYEKALKIVQKSGNKRIEGIIEQYIAESYQQKRQYNQAQLHYNRALNLFKQIESKENIAKIHVGIGQIYALVNEDNQALTSYLKALEIQRGLKDKNGLSIAYSGIADLYIKTENAERAIEYLKQSLNIAESLKNKELIRNNHRQLSQAYEKLKDTQAALDHYKLFKIYNDSIYNDSKATIINGLQTRYNLEQKEKESNAQKMQIELLTEQSAEQKINLLSQEQDIRQKRTIITAYTVIFVLTVSLLFVLYRGRVKINRVNKQLQNQNEEISRQKIEIEKKNEQLVQAFLKISDSIKYAETIQKAILPSETKLSQVLNEYFVISKAKEVVSGDFYWVSKIGDKTFVAVIDCTGHGVSGGFTSMIGHTLLNEIINQSKVYQPSQVLELLNKGVINVVEKQYQDIAIGMEACVAVIEPLPDDQNKVKLQYAGAKRPLYSIPQNGHPEAKTRLMEIRGDRQPIGFFLDSTRIYTSQEIILQKGSLIYLTSDGFIDQADPKNKRFGTPKLKRVLKEIANKSLIEQKNYLEKALQEHQADAKQRDDITLMGFKV